MKSWILEASDDGKTFTEIDRHLNSDKLVGNDKIAKFTANHEFPNRIIRLRQIGESSGDKSAPNHFLCFRQIIFYGILFE